MNRKIIHVDMDAFYASVEQRDDPALRGRPVIVAWAGSARSVVCASSYEARRFGVYSAMPTSRARRLCPAAVVVNPTFEKYRTVSRQVREIFNRHTSMVEPLSLDEAYLDVTVELTGIATATETAEVIRGEIRDELSLTASAGVAPNKFLAKIASDWRKPDGQFVIKPHQIMQFLEPLPVSKLPGVGKATEKIFTDRGVITVGQLALMSSEELESLAGKFGRRLWELARGIDDRPVESARETKSISSETTFETDISLLSVREQFPRLAADVWKNLEKKQLQARTLTVKLRASDFKTATRRRSMPAHFNSALEIEQLAAELLQNFAFGDAAVYRLAGVCVSNFGAPAPDGEEQEAILPQNQLFEEPG